MRRFAVLVVLWLVVTVACQPVDSPVDADGTNAAKAAAIDGKAPPSPTAAALARPGDVGDEQSIIMVNGRAITPVGEIRATQAFPGNVIVLPDGNLVVITMRGDERGFTIFDGDTLDEISRVVVSAPFFGLTANAAGDKLWVSGGKRQRVMEYDLVAGEAFHVRDIPSMLLPANLALVPNEEKLLVTSSFGAGLQIVDLDDGLMEAHAPTNLYPVDVVVSPDGHEAYTANWGDETVTVVNLQTAQRSAEIQVGFHPESLALSADGGTLYAANSDEDTISVIDVASRTETATLDVYRAAEMAGASPVDLALSSDGDTLYVVCAGLDAVVVFDTESGERLGSIPTGYYPTTVALDEARDALLVTNGKGGGIPTDTPSWGVNQTGTLQKIALPTPSELADYTQQVTDNLTRTELFWETQMFDSPIPTERGVPSTQIKRVVFIMKENKTYDQVLSDIPGGEREPAFLEFGAGITPNTHELAEQFTNCDNYYSEADASVQGHMWSTLMYSNDYMERARMMSSSSRYPLTNIEPAAQGVRGSIFRHMYENDVTFRAYGQVITIGDTPDLLPYFDLKYGFWNLGVSDETKADEVIREMEAGIWPQFVYISLPNDHTNGSDEGEPTIPYYVGDNDAGLGKLVEYITHSDYWHETAIIITEDDPQSGIDHVDAHRTIALVASPYAKRGYISSVLYSMPSIWMTVEMIFGLPPLTVYDEHTSPMYDCFTTDTDMTPYDAVPNPVPLEYNPAGLALADYSRNQRWDAPDQVQRLGEIVWSVMRPGERWPAEFSVDSYYVDEDEDEDDDAGEYRAAAEWMMQEARRAGLWNGERLPTIKELVADGVLKVGHTKQ
ncbi:MAG: bifunctional YncE family protein/alkaline phosphatase family protein [Candidatus Lernaella stagnicola]|nr:bifunctional YncE family protein/alkaline phosphatase family protein [Candidatus Lernaella stagnicola]